jgi:hypothetical protein
VKRYVFPQLALRASRQRRCVHHGSGASGFPAAAMRASRQRRFGLPGSGDGVAASATTPLLRRRVHPTRPHSLPAGPVTLAKRGIATALADRVLRGVRVAAF